MNRIELPTSEATSTADLTTQPCLFFHTEATDFRNWDGPPLKFVSSDALELVDTAIRSNRIGNVRGFIQEANAQ